jgi:hypothetical protein
VSNALYRATRELRLTATQKHVLLVLADAARDPEDPERPCECWPSIPTLMHWTGLPRSTLLRTLAQLEQLEHIHRDHEAGSVTSYRVLVPVPLRDPVSHTPVPQGDGTRPEMRPHPSRSGTQIPQRSLSEAKEAPPPSRRRTGAPVPEGDPSRCGTGEVEARWARLEAIRAVSEDAYNTALKLELRDGLPGVMPTPCKARLHR